MSPAPPTFAAEQWSLTGTSVDRKIERPAAHARDLMAELDAFTSRQPYRVSEEVRSWQGIEYRVVIASGIAEPPGSLVVLLGDFVHNLRSALDHLVGAMLPTGPTRGSAFPIYTRRYLFEKYGLRHLRGAPRAAVKRIEGMQPYDRRFGRPRLARIQWEALASLEALENTDKHRTILLATSVVLPDYAVHNRAEGDSGIGHRIARGVAEWWFPIDGRDPHFAPHFDTQVVLGRPPIGFSDDWPREIVGMELDPMLDWLFRCVVWSVVPHLREFIVRA